MEDQMSIETLLKLEANPAYKLSPKQRMQLDKYRTQRFKNNPDFAKHSTSIKTPKASELKNAKTTDSN